jgi:hypothetical protein
MLERVQRRLGSEARASNGLRFGRDWSVVLAALGLILAAPSAIIGSSGAVLLILTAGLALLSGAWYSVLAAYFGCRERDQAEIRRTGLPPDRGVRSRDLGADGAVPKEILGDWLLTVSLFPVATGVAFVEGAEALVAAALMGFTLAATRARLRRSLPDRISMSDAERVGLIRLLKLTAAVGAVGYFTVIIIAILGGDTWLPIWPGVLLGLLCGAASVVQLARTTARARHGR